MDFGNSHKSVLLAIASLLALGRAASADADLSLPEEPLRLEAQRLRYDLDADLLECEGRVRVRSDHYELEAQRARYDRSAGLLEADGEVRFSGEGVRFEAQRLFLDLESAAGRAEEVRMEARRDSGGGFRWESAEITRGPDGQWVIQEGWGTPCRCEDPNETPPWSVAFSNAEIEEEGYAYCDDFRFKLFGVPALYLPKMAFPAKSRRATGLLIPKLRYSNRKGFGFLQPLFVVLGEDAQATLRAGGYSRLGPNARLEGQWRLDGFGIGSAKIEYQRMENESIGDLGTFSLSGDYSLGAGGRLITEAEIANRAGTRSWLEDRIADRLTPYDRSRALWNLPSPDGSIWASSVYHLRHDRADAAESDAQPGFHPWLDAPYQAKPLGMRLRRLASPILEAIPLFWRGEADASYLLRRDIADGETDSAMRADFSGGLSGGVRLWDRLAIYPVAEFRHTQYRVPEESDPNRSMTQSRLGLETGAGVYRIFGAQRAARWRHRLDVRAGTLWEETQRDGETPVWNARDVVEDANGPYLRIANHLHRAQDDAPTQRLLWWDFTQSLDLRETGDDRWAPLRTRISLDALSWGRLEGEARWDWRRGALDSARTAIEIDSGRGDRLQAAYRKGDGWESGEGAAEVRLFDSLSFYASARYDFKRAVRLESDYGMRYESQCRCWTLDVTLFDRWRPEETGREIGGRVQFQLTGLGES